MNIKKLFIYLFIYLLISNYPLPLNQMVINDQKTKERKRERIIFSQREFCI
jgi:hypothetical protein